MSNIPYDMMILCFQYDTSVGSDSRFKLTKYSMSQEHVILLKENSQPN